MIDCMYHILVPCIRCHECQSLQLTCVVSSSITTAIPPLSWNLCFPGSTTKRTLDHNISIYIVIYFMFVIFILSLVPLLIIVIIYSIEFSKFHLPLPIQLFFLCIWFITVLSMIFLSGHVFWILTINAFCCFFSFLTFLFSQFI